MTINLDYVKLFSNLTMSGNLIQHGSAAINKTMMTNTAKGGFMSPLFITSIANVTFESVAKVSQNNKEVVIYFNKKSGDKIVNIYNTSGQLLQNTSTKEDYLSLSLTTLSQGCYFIVIKADNQTLSKQIFIH